MSLYIRCEPGLLLQIADGKTFGVSKPDRLGRNAQDVGATIKSVAVRHVEVIVLQLGNLDLASAAGIALGRSMKTSDAQRQ